MPYIELAARWAIFRPAKEEVARSLHDALPLDHALALVTFELRRQAFEHGRAGFFDLQEQWRAIAAGVEPDGAEGANAADANHFEGDVPQRIAIEQATAIRRESRRIGVERPFDIDVMADVTFGLEMI